MKDMTNKSLEDIADSIMDTMDIDSIMSTLHSLLVKQMEVMEGQELAEYLEFYNIQA